MPSDDSTAKARSYLETLCSVKPNRRTGSPGNREATAFVAGPDTHLHSQPARAIEAALAKAGFGADELRAVEINEAFAAVGLQSTRELGLDAAIVNPRGGAIALGHPLGASGARIVGSLAVQLAELGPDALGAVGICGGGGQGSAVVLRAL